MSGITQQFAEIIEYGAIGTFKFEEVLTIYRDYFEVGCDYLINNCTAVFKLLDLSVVPNEKMPVCELSTQVVDYFLTNPTKINNLHSVLKLYGTRSFPLVYLLVKYKESLVNYLKRSIGVESGTGETPKKTETPKKAETLAKVSNCVHAWPDVKYMKDIDSGLIKNLRACVKLNPFEDKIFHVIVNNKTNNVKDVYVSGSKALKMFYEAINKNINTKLNCKVDPNDTDVFHLNSGKVTRAKIGNVDLVYTTYKKIDDVLLNFDLPCCRVSTNDTGNFWISAQCLLAIFGNDVIMPEYVKNRKQLFTMYKDHTRGAGLINSHIDKLENRIKKYEARGFSFGYVHTDKPMNFIINCDMYNKDVKMLFDD